MNNVHYKLPLISPTDIRPPKNGHSASDHEKLERLVRAYERGERVRPVVVITGWRDKRQRAIALVGSHRVAAMKRVYEHAHVPEKHLILIDEDMLASALSPEMEVVLARYVDDEEIARHEYDLLLRAVAEASDALREALGDQVC